MDVRSVQDQIDYVERYVAGLSPDEARALWWRTRPPTEPEPTEVNR